MRQLWRAAVVVIMLAAGTSSPAAAVDPFDDAFNTYMAGEHKAAIRLMDALGRDGDIRAQYMMGRMYSEGEGVGQNDKTAAQWYKVAADRGDVVSQLSLGTLYVNGRGVNQNFVKAYKLVHPGLLERQSYRQGPGSRGPRTHYPAHDAGPGRRGRASGGLLAPEVTKGRL
jgi:TPR repeat protein